MNTDHINTAIEFSGLVESTLGPKGMNKMIIVDDHPVITNDGATIVNCIKRGHPIFDLFKDLASAQEKAIGDGTTTTVTLAGQLLRNALVLMNKGLHPTTIITGYALANMESLKFLDSIKEEPNVEAIIKTAFGTKISKDQVEHFTKILKSVKDFKNLKYLKLNNSNPLESEVYKGYVFEAYPINDRMKKEINGKIAILDFKTNVKEGNINVNSAQELINIENTDRDYKKHIVDELIKNKVELVFYTDTNPEFEAYLTKSGITGVVIFKRELVDNICQATGATACSGYSEIKDSLGVGKFRFEQDVRSNIPNRIYLDGDIETFILKGPTNQTLDEIERAIDDVVSLLRHDTHMVVGAGCIEIELAKHLSLFADKIGGKEQLAINSFAEAIESIPLIIAKNAGLDAIEILTTLKSLHSQDKDLGVDVFQGISNARERGIFEPVLVKTSAINSATNVANLILKLDGILNGEGKQESS